MRVITLNELNSRTDLEIAVLFHIASQALGRTTPGTPARRAVISSLQISARRGRTATGGQGAGALMPRLSAAFQCSVGTAG